MIDKLFLSVGAMKAGTTWLHHQLADHSEIFFTPEKEIHYFAAPNGRAHPMRSEDRVRRFQRVVSNLKPENMSTRVRANLVWYTRRYLNMRVGPAWYIGLFAGHEPDQWCADFSNLYSTLDGPGWARIRGTAHKLRVVYTLRHPLRRMWSHVKFHHEFSGQDRNLGSWSREQFEAFFTHPMESAQLRYAENLTQLRASLSEEELRIQFFDSIRSEPQELLNGIERFLGIAERAYPDKRLRRAVNTSTPMEMSNEFIAFGRPVHDAEVAALQALGLVLPDSWY